MTWAQLCYRMCKVFDVLYGLLGFGGYGMKAKAYGLFLLALALLSLAGVVKAENGKELMLIFTTDTNAELNPCG